MVWNGSRRETVETVSSFLDTVITWLKPGANEMRPAVLCVRDFVGMLTKSTSNTSARSDPHHSTTR